MRSYTPVLKGHSGQIKKAVKLLLEAKRPMIYTGGGLVLGDGAEELIKLARALNYPVTNTLMGLGGYPATDKQFVGMLGMHGTYEANMAMQNCDVLIAVGARFDDRVIGNPKHFGSKDAPSFILMWILLAFLNASKSMCRLWAMCSLSWQK
jgi:acetolactate synthase I/II/III large subunit